MGNCFIKKTENEPGSLEAEFFFLHKENLRSYDIVRRELKNIQSSIYELQHQNQFMPKSFNPHSKISTV